MIPPVTPHSSLSCLFLPVLGHDCGCGCGCGSGCSRGRGLSFRFTRKSGVDADMDPNQAKPGQIRNESGQMKISGGRSRLGLEPGEISAIVET